MFSFCSMQPRLADMTSYTAKILGRGGYNRDLSGRYRLCGRFSGRHVLEGVPQSRNVRALSHSIQSILEYEQSDWSKPCYHRRSTPHGNRKTNTASGGLSIMKILAHAIIVGMIAASAIFLSTQFQLQAWAVFLV